MSLRGVYLVINPAMKDPLIEKLSKALAGGLGLVQIWNNWPNGLEKAAKKMLIDNIKQLCQEYHVPILMHDDWQMALEMNLDGVHFDELPANWQEVLALLRHKIVGVTVGNDIDRIHQLKNMGLSYLSFCALFPSPSVSSCEIVTPEVIQKTRQVTDLPLFLSGGIRPDNLEQLKQLDFQGVAVISGIMSADDPKQRVAQYHTILKRIQIEK